MTQSRIIKELKNKLKPRQGQLQLLHKKNDEVESKLNKSRQHNDDLRVKVEDIERKLTGTKKELASKISQVKKKTEDIFEIEKKLQDLSYYTHDFTSLKKQLTKLSHKYESPETKLVKKRDSGEIRLSLEERKSDILKKKIKGKQEILKRNINLHQNRMSKLKSDKILLEKVSSMFAIYSLFSFLLADKAH